MIILKNRCFLHHLHIKALFKRAYEEKVFAVDHSGNVDEMSDGEINSLICAYINRTGK